VNCSDCKHAVEHSYRLIPKPRYPTWVCTAIRYDDTSADAWIVDAEEYRATMFVTERFLCKLWEAKD